MKTRPLGLSLFFGMMCVLALSFPVQICLAEEISIFSFSEWWHQLTWLNLLVMALMCTTGYVAYNASRFIYISAPATFILVALNNWWVGYVGLNYSMLNTTLATLGFAFTVTPLFFGKAKAAIQNQNIHWWRMAKRRKVSIPVAIHPWVGESLTATSFDISESGAFISLKNGQQLNVGDKMQMRLSISGHIEIRCTARAVRKNEATGSYPRGVGIVFEDINSQDKKVLRDLASL